MHNKSIKFAHKQRGLGLGDTTRLAPYFKRYTKMNNYITLNIIAILVILLTSAGVHAENNSSINELKLIILNNSYEWKSLDKLKEIDEIINTIEALSLYHNNDIEMLLVAALAYERKFFARLLVLYKDDKMITYYQRDETRNIVRKIYKNLNKVKELLEYSTPIDHNILVNTYQSFFGNDEFKALVLKYIKNNYKNSFLLIPRIKQASSKLLCMNSNKTPIVDSTNRVHKKTLQSIGALLTVLPMYYERYRMFPTQRQGISALLKLPTEDKIPHNWKPYIKKVPVDQSGNEYKYQLETIKHGYQITIWSDTPINKNCKVGISEQYKFIENN